jgi:hypothetical protein
VNEVNVGDRVLYSPCEDTHHLDRDSSGDLLWHHVHGDGPRKGQALELKGTLTCDEGGTLRTAAGHKVIPHCCRHYWPAVVEAVHEDGTCDLTIRHPNGCATLYYPRVKQDADRAPHTFHLPNEQGE